MERIKDFLLFILLTLVPTILFGQYTSYETITELNGLSDNRVTCFKKDRDGFMWIGTANGLNRYDGHTFLIYRPGQSTRKISYEHVNDIEQDASGRMWVATWNGLNVLDPVTNDLRVFTPDLDEKKRRRTKIASSLIWDVFIDNQQRVWMAPDVRDLCYYDQQTDAFVYFPWREYVNKSLPQYKDLYKSIHKIAAKSSHELWLGTTHGLFSFNMLTKKFSYYGGDKAEDIAAMFVDGHNGDVYFGQENLYRYSTAKNKLIGIRKTGATSAYHMSDNALLVPTIRGLWTVDVLTNTASPFPTDSKKIFSIHHDKKSCVYYSDDLLWLGTENGIRLFDMKANVFPYVQVFPDTVRYETGNVFDVLKDQNSNLYYISSYTQNCLIMMNTNTGKREVVRTIENKPLRFCTKIYKDSRDRIWVLSDGYIFYKDKDSNSFRIFRKTKEHRSFAFVDMLQDEIGNFWFVSMHNGVYVYEPFSDSFRLLSYETDGIITSRPTAIAEDTVHHVVWITDYGYGAYMYDLTTKKFAHHKVDTSDPQFLQSALITDVAVDASGNAWISTTSGGLSKYNFRKRQFSTITMNNGLRENTLLSVMPDNQGAVWVTSEKGITKLDTAGNILNHFDSNSWLPVKSFSTPISTSPNGEFLIGVQSGFLKFHPDSLQFDTRDFSVVLTAIRQGDDLYLPQRKNEFLYTQNELTFSYTALCYTHTNAVSFEIKLDGYDKEWKKMGDEHAVRYTNLMEGEYTFLVRAFDFNHKPSQNIAQFTFVVHPPVWRQWWFVLLIIALLIFGVVQLVMRLMKKIKAQQLITEIATALYQEQTLDGVFHIVAEACRTKLHFETCYVAKLPTIQESRNRVPNVEDPFFKQFTVAEIKNHVTPYLKNASPYKLVSRLVVPVFVEGIVVGIIYSEHSRNRFFTRWHLKTMQEIASLCSVKMDKYFAEDAIRSRVARDLHDDIGSTLSSINIMSQLAISGKGNAGVHLSKIAENSQRMMENMSDIVWSINPENDSLEHVVSKMREFAAEILEPLDISYSFQIDESLMQKRLNLERRKNVFLIFKEAVNNAAKYSGGNELSIDLKFVSNQLELIVRDNGKGFDLSNSMDGNGLRNMQSRAEQLYGKLEVESIREGGTWIHLTVPIT